MKIYLVSSKPVSMRNPPVPLAIGPWSLCQGNKRILTHNTLQALPWCTVIRNPKRPSSSSLFRLISQVKSLKTSNSATKSMAPDMETLKLLSNFSDIGSL